MFISLARERGLVALVVVVALVDAAAQAQTTERVSVSSAGAQGNGHSSAAAISASGRFVAFESAAFNLVADDTNNVSDVFVHDRQTDETTRVSVSAAGGPGAQFATSSRAPAISADGRFVSFYNENPPAHQVFVHDRVTGATTMASVSSAGVAGDGPSTLSSISGDGRYVAFHSESSNLVAGAAFGQVYVRDRVAGVTMLVSVTPTGAAAGAGGPGGLVELTPVISADGAFVAFYSSSSTILPPHTGAQIYVRDLAAGATEIVSVSSAGVQGNQGGTRPAISGDGRYVAFRSASGDLVPGVPGSPAQIYVRDRMTGTTIVASRSSTGELSSASCEQPTISSDGRVVGFSTFASNLSPAGGVGVQIYARDVVTAQTTLVSLSTRDEPANFGCFWPSASGDGRLIAFHSSATNLVPGITGVADDVFVRDRLGCVAADFNCSGAVNAADLAILLGAWGPCPAVGPCPADLNGDGAVNAADLAMLLGAWG